MSISSRPPTSRSTRAGLAVAIFSALVAGSGRNVRAQAPAPAAPAQDVTSPPAINAPVVSTINLTAARSMVLTTPFDITRIAVTNPAIADATVVQPREILIDGKGAGTVSLIIWGATERLQYDVVVAQPVSTLQQRLAQLFPGEDIVVTANDDAIILSGHVSSTTIMLQAAEVAQASSAKGRLINMLQPPGGTESKQVMLQVRFAEVNRKAVTELGTSFFQGSPGLVKNYIGRVTTQQFPSANLNADGSLTFSDFLNIFVLNTQYNVGTLIHALQQKGFFQSLAEPNLIAYDGQEASFLAGGEFPVPIAQGGSVGAISVQFREFGVRLTFRPIIAGDTIRLHVKPEVSSLDFSNGVTLGGFRIPALTSRRAETDVELRDGQSFAIAGLLDNTTQEDGSAIPILGSIPIIGNLFKSRATTKAQTELMVLITPRLVRPLSPDEVPSLPIDQKRFLPGAGGGTQFEGGGGVVDAPPVKPNEE